MLSMASTLAGNLTITGSVANIIVVERARPEVRITFWRIFAGRVPNRSGDAGVGMDVAVLGAVRWRGFQPAKFRSINSFIL